MDPRSSRLTAETTSYEVVLPGELAPALLAALSSLGVDHAEVSTVFLLPALPGEGLPGVVAHVQAHGLRVLDVRPVTRPMTPGPVSGSSCEGDARGPRRWKT